MQRTWSLFHNIDPVYEDTNRVEVEWGEKIHINKMIQRIIFNFPLHNMKLK